MYERHLHTICMKIEKQSVAALMEVIEECSSVSCYPVFLPFLIECYETSVCYRECASMEEQFFTSPHNNVSLWIINLQAAGGRYIYIYMPLGRTNRSGLDIDDLFDFFGIRPTEPTTV
uniref:Uncharacterized protein n=1 Tax=Musca domestica TaxID=7370 RepID=A0A1I8NKS0_MUSDO